DQARKTWPCSSVSSSALIDPLAPPVDLPLREHRLRFVPCEVEKTLCPGTEPRITKQAARRAHCPELLVGGLSHQQGLPAPLFAAACEPAPEVADPRAQATKGPRLHRNLIESFVAPDHKVPGLLVGLGDRGPLPGSRRRRCER